MTVRQAYQTGFVLGFLPEIGGGGVLNYDTCGGPHCSIFLVI